MEIFETIRLEHAALRDLLDQVIDQTEPDQATPRGEDVLSWHDALRELKRALVAHDRAEETVVYEVLKKLPHRAELAEQKEEEHQLAEELLEDVERMSPTDADWAERLALFKNQLESHLAEEETLVFSLLETFINNDYSQRLAAEFSRVADDIRERSTYDSSEATGQTSIHTAGLDLNS